MVSITMHPVILITALNILTLGNYIVSYNSTIGFANYAAAVCNYSTHAQTCMCTKAPLWIPSENYTCADYTGTGYDRGHLIPNAEYGAATCNLANAVPMNKYFNRVTWRMEEQYLRDEYRGAVVFRGCDFGDTSIETQTGKLMRIPTGCYWVVTNSTQIEFQAGLVDYAYVSMDTFQISKQLPWWIRLVDTAPPASVNIEHDNYLWIPGTVLLVISAVILVIMYTIAYLSRRQSL